MGPFSPISGYYGSGYGDPEDMRVSLGLQRRVQRMGRFAIRSIARGYFAQELTEGLEELTGNEDQNAFSGISRIGSNALANGMMYGSAYGLGMGLVIGTFQEMRAGLADLKKQVEEEIREREKKNEHLEKLLEHYEKRRSHIEAHAAAQVPKLIEQYQGFRDPS